MKVEELQEDKDFQQFLYEFNTAYRNGLTANSGLSALGHRARKVKDSYLKWATDPDYYDSFNETRKAVWELIIETIIYRVKFKAPEPYVPGNTSDSVPDVYADAVKAVTGPRNKDYGTVLDNFKAISFRAELIAGLVVTPMQVALLSICIKLGRLVNTPNHYDSLVDIIGYCLCMFQLIEHYEDQSKGDYHTRDTDRLPNRG